MAERRLEGDTRRAVAAITFPAGGVDPRCCGEGGGTGVREKSPRLGAQTNAATGADEEGDAEVRGEPGEVAAQARLCQAECRGRRGHAAVLGDGDEPGEEGEDRTKVRTHDERVCHRCRICLCVIDRPVSNLAHMTSTASREPHPGYARGDRDYQRLLAAMVLAGVVTLGQLYSPQGMLPLVAADIGVSAAHASLLIGAATLGLALGVLPWSFIADRHGRVRAMSISLIAATALGATTALVPGFDAMLVLRFAEGLALAGVPAAALAFVQEETAPADAPAAMGGYIAGTTIGGLAGRLIAAPIGEMFGWRVGSLAFAALAAAAAAGFLLLVPPAQRFRPVPATMSGTMRSALAHLARPGMRGLFAIGFLLMGAFVAAYNYIGFHLEAPPYLVSTGAASLLFLAYLGGTVSSRLAGSAVRRRGLPAVLGSGILLMLLGGALMFAAPLPVIVLGLLIFTVGFFAAHTMATSWVGVRAESGRAQASALYNLFYYGGSSVVGWAAGLVFGAAGWAAALAAVLGLVILAGLFTLREAYRSPRSASQRGS